jgi:hypothetical protein
MAFRTTMYLSSPAAELKDRVPRSVSLSKMLQCLIVAAATPDDKEYEKILKGNPDLAEAREEILTLLKIKSRRKVEVYPERTRKGKRG